MQPRPLLGGIDAGGTKFLCLVAGGPENIRDEIRIPTTTPEATLAQVVRFFLPYCATHEIAAIGIGCFGPLDVRKDSATFGTITSTPKPSWQNVDVLGPLRSALDVPIVMDTDVNAAALGEGTWGAGVANDPFLYVTVGTGIGGALLWNGVALSGLTHPEMGHIRIQHDTAADPFPGSCPFHGDCFEGLANGPAIQKRLGRSAEELSDDDQFWDLEARYIGDAVATYVLMLSPRRIILGGGVMSRTFLFPKIRSNVQKSLAGYVPELDQRILGEGYIVPPVLGDHAGALGAIQLASRIL